MDIGTFRGTRNEEVDRAAKEAAEGRTSGREQLPAILRKEKMAASKAAVKQRKGEEVKRRSWSEEWRKSDRYERMSRVDPHHPYKKFRQWRDGLSRNQGSILVQLGSGHLPINSYFKKIGQRDNDHCNWCKEREGRETPETVNHLVLDCPVYENERDIMVDKLGRSNTYELAKIFSKEANVKELLNFLDATRRFRRTHGILRTIEDN